MIELLSRASVVASGTRRLAAAGVDQAAREAWWIWDKVSGESQPRSCLAAEHPVDAIAAGRFEAAVLRRCAGEPLAYVLGEAAFRHQLLRSDPRALIPRPETEGLIDLVLAKQPEGRVLDVGAGTACIALSLAWEGRYDLVVAVERSADALALARVNVDNTGIPVLLVRGDLSTMAGAGTFDVLVSNPPYLTQVEYDGLSPAVKEWEPKAALAGGRDGLEATKRLLGDGIRVLRAGGWIALEIDGSRAHLATELAQAAGWAEIAVFDDLFGRARYLLARRSEQS